MKNLLILLAFCLTGWTATRVPPASAQELTPRFGLGFNALISTPDGLGLGLRGRASAPVNQDLSIGVDLGFTGFIFKGRDEATYVFDPQVSAIITFPSTMSQAPYLLAGIGAYLPLSDNDDEGRGGGPTIHGGVGRVQVLRETTIFYEVNPALIVGETKVHLAIPLRIGLIF